MSKKYTVARLKDFPSGSRLRVEINKQRIAVFNIDGRFYAINDKCPHQFAPLSRGRLQGTVICNAQNGWKLSWESEGEILVCPGHGMEFDVKTGKGIGYKLKLRTYEVVIEDDDVRLVL